MSEKTKRCPKCDTVKPVGEFNRNRSSPDGLQGRCRECERRWREENRSEISDRRRKSRKEGAAKIAEQRRAWRLSNPEKVASHRRNYREKHREGIAQKDREYNQRNKARIAEKKREYRERNPDKFRQWHQDYRSKNQPAIAARHREWSGRNRGKASEKNRRWRQENPDKVIANTHRRRARKLEAPGDYKASDWPGILAVWGNECALCGLKCRKLTVGHIIPLTRMGTNWTWNIRPECGPCNSKKRDKLDCELDEAPHYDKSLTT